MKAIFECSQEQFECIHAAVDKARKGSEVVKVSKAALAALLRDHSRLVAQAQDNR